MTMKAYRNITALLWLVAFISTMATAYAVNVDEYLPSKEKMEVFGTFRDGTLTAFIAIVAIVMNFATSLLREHSNTKTQQAEVDKARIHAEALAGLGTKVDHCREQLTTRLDQWGEDRPCIMGLRYGPQGENDK